MQKQIKIRAGKYMFPVLLIREGERLFFQFRFNKILKNEIKSMQGARWHGFDEEKPRKLWSIPINARNLFQLNYLMGNNPYAKYDLPLVDVKTSRPLYKHQLEMVAHALTRHYCIIAGEMGTGKTLAAIEVLEHLNVQNHEAWYIGPKSGVKAVERELLKWKSKVFPRMYTYEQLVKTIDKWESGRLAPKIVIFDESSKIKNPNAQRSKAACHLADSVRQDHKKDGYIILMSGSPAPKTPVDWWNQCEIACPGFLREGHIGAFKQRLCIIQQKESIAGGMYPHIVSWLDDSRKCSICGEFENKHLLDSDHKFSESKNEVKYLYERLKGLVLVKFKKDCLDLPDKRYEEIQLTPTTEILRLAKLISTTSPRAIQALTLLRELSDGFQYKDKIVGEIQCKNCNGLGTEKVQSLKNSNNVTSEITENDFEIIEQKCHLCSGKGVVPNYERSIETIESPKDDKFIDLLDMHEEVGRFIVWGGFTGTIDRLVKIAHENAWYTLRVDGRGYFGSDPMGNTVNSDILLDAMDLSHPNYKSLYEGYPKICFVGHPQAGGMALTLTASPTALYYSNSFDGTARIQSEDRFHRAGMDINRACTVIDLLHLPTDKLVLNNLKQKKKLQNLSMGELKDAFVLAENSVSRNS